MKYVPLEKLNDHFKIKQDIQVLNMLSSHDLPLL